MTHCEHCGALAVAFGENGFTYLCGHQTHGDGQCPTEREWTEYLAWTRGAASGQYEVTEAHAWRRLQLARLARRATPYGFPSLKEEHLALLRGAPPIDSPPGG